MPNAVTVLMSVMQNRFANYSILYRTLEVLIMQFSFHMLTTLQL